MHPIIMFLLAAILWWTSPGLAQEAKVIEVGKREFRGHCAICHGLDGKGDSVMTSLNLLVDKPPDLTQLSKQNDGTFPFWRVYRIIDGREPVKGHGTPGMPVWGDVFLNEEGTGPRAESRAIGRILEIVYYLESLQQK